MAIAEQPSITASSMDFTSQLEDEIAAPKLYPDTCTLPGGWRTEDDMFVTDAHLRELTGRDEETLARTLAKGGDLAWFNWVNKVVLVGTLSIGGLPLDEKGLGRMLVGDRDMLFMHVRMATYGTDFETTITCPFCQRESQVAFELEKDIPIRESKHGEQVYKRVKLTRGKYAEVRLTTVSDQEKALADASMTVKEQNTLLYAEVIRSINGQPTLGVGSVLDMGAADRKIVEDYLRDAAPGPRFGEVVAECPKCNQEAPINLNMAAMFP